MSVEAVGALFAREALFGDKNDDEFYPTKLGW